MPRQKLTCDCLVIGSGPGGAITATLLAEAGIDVILAEEGPHIPVGKVPSYSLQEMDLKYRNGGLNVSFGKEKVSYLEGCCVGGASEINAGLYHRPLIGTLNDWAKDFCIKDFTADSLEKFFTANEHQMAIGNYPGNLPMASQLIRDAAEKLGWQNSEIPRMWHYGSGKRQSMSEIFIPRFLKAGGRLMAGLRIQRLNIKGEKAKEATSRTKRISFNHVFVCGGAIQTPVLLRRSGIRNNVGNGLRMHPAVRVVARFGHDVNDLNEGVPVYQVSEFKPQITLGGSFSGKPHLALWLAGCADFAKILKEHKRMVIFYALIMALSTGKVRALPFVDEPVVTLPMVQKDWDLLHTGLGHLEKLAKAAGAKEIIKSQRIDLSTIHLFCSCPMGEDKTRCAVDSFGKAHGHDNIYLNDASILPSSPGVNPQATIMAIARRNADHFLEHL